MNNGARVGKLLAAAVVGLVPPVSISQAACTAGALDTAFGASTTGGYVQSQPIFLNGTDQGTAGVVTSPIDDGIAVNMVAGIDSTSTAILGLTKFKRGGTMDNTFGGFGLASPGGYAPTASGYSSALAQDPAGNLIVARGDGAGITVTRFSASGDLDTTFGTSGSASIALTNVFAITGAYAATDGSVFVATSATNPAATNSMQPVVLKFTSAGVPDSSFGTAGVSYVYPSSLGGAPTFGRGTDVVVLASGQVLVAGRFQTTPGHRVFFVARLSANGAPDATFGTGGFTLADFSPAYPFAQGRKLAVQADGKIVLAGTVSDSSGNGAAVGLIRLLANGALDPGFGIGGFASATTSFGIDAFNVALQNNGKILVGSSILNDALGVSTTAAVARFTAVGTLDTVFGGGGYATVTPPGWDGSAGGDVVYLSGGKILLHVAASRSSTSLSTQFLVRLDSGSGAGCH